MSVPAHCPVVEVLLYGHEGQLMLAVKIDGYARRLPGHPPLSRWPSRQAVMLGRIASEFCLNIPRFSPENCKLIWNFDYEDDQKHFATIGHYSPSPMQVALFLRFFRRGLTPDLRRS